jgi:uncharacterized protein (DUF2345 family)
MDQNNLHQDDVVFDRLTLLKHVSQEREIYQLLDAVITLSERVKDLESALLVRDGSLQIQSGDASLSLKKDGTIEIRGKNIDIVGSGRINVKAGAELSLKGSNILQN